MLQDVLVHAPFLKEFLDGYDLFQDNPWIEFSYLEKNSRGRYRSPKFFRFVLLLGARSSSHESIYLQCFFIVYA